MTDRTSRLTATVSQQPRQPPERLPPKLRDELSRAVADAPDAQPVQLRADLVRALLRAHEPGPTEAAVTIRDEQRRVTYVARVSTGQDGRVWLAGVRVEPDDSDQAEPDPRVWRVPARELAALAAEALAVHALAAEPEHTVTAGVALPDPDAPPDAAELAALVRAGVRRQAIAERYGRSLSRVDDWLRLARRERPELFPPRRRGPKPKPPGGDNSQPGNPPRHTEERTP